jgi:ABC transporter substrate binding protein (PQQ-dependent alcohol dehydrogenase system)
MLSLRTSKGAWRDRLLLLSLILLLGASPAAAQQGASMLKVGYLAQAIRRPPPEPYLDPAPADEGLAGARLGIEDDNTTGRFTGQAFALDEQVVGEDGDVAQAFKKLVADGIRLVVADLPAPALSAVAALPEAANVTLFNAGAPDDELRAAKCRANLLHTLPSRAMLADALVQYLLAKQWKTIFLAVGPTDADRAYADAVKRSIQKFHARLAAEQPWTYEPGARRTDTGHFAVQAEVARFSQGVSYDVLVVADEEDAFGDEMMYRTYDPRPVAGTEGLVATAWARPHQQWGATQLQNRFLRLAKRWMTDRDYAAWMAVRAIGEAATRTQSVDPDALMKFMRSDKFELAAFKGARLSFRPWDGQLRQPVLLVDARSLVSVSPQPGFLHQFSELDTLGIDRPETKCKLQ